jgi:ubiquinone/menaquinone biosynthesis C-methylase UbiE
VPEGSQTSVTYVMGYTDEERRRLVEQAELLRRYTKRMLEDVGIRQGTRVLDVGCGVGDVSMLTAAAVGPTGRVVAVDNDPRSLEIARERSEAAGFANIVFVEADLRTLDLSRQFDAVVGRLVLMHLPDPVSAVRRFAQHVVPGGIVAFQEAQIDFPPGFSFPQPLPIWEQALDWIRAAYRHVGAETNMGLKLQQVFVDAGLGAPAMHMDTHFMTTGDRLGPLVSAHALRSILPLAERFGMASAEDLSVDTFEERLRAEIASAGAAVSWVPIVSAWSRTPSTTNGGLAFRSGTRRGGGEGRRGRRGHALPRLHL